MHMYVLCMLQVYTNFYTLKIFQNSEFLVKCSSTLSIKDIQLFYNINFISVMFFYLFMKSYVCICIYVYK